MITFKTRIHGIPCKVRVTRYVPEVPMRVYGPGWGDADPPEAMELDYELLDLRGRRAMWLDKYITREFTRSVEEDFIVLRMADYYTQEPE